MAALAVALVSAKCYEVFMLKFLCDGQALSGKLSCVLSCNNYEYSDCKSSGKLTHINNLLYCPENGSM